MASGRQCGNFALKALWKELYSVCIPAMSIKTQALNEKVAAAAQKKILCVEDKAPLADVLKSMRQGHAHCALVVKGKKLVGIFTERDYLMKVAATAKLSRPVSEFMTADPITIRLDDPIGQAVEIMQEHGVRNLPLADKAGRPVALLTVSGLIAYLADHFPAAVVNRPPDARVTEHVEGA